MPTKLNQVFIASLVLLTVQTSHAYDISGRAWNDLNRDGIQDAGEPGLPGVVFRLFDTNVITLIDAPIFPNTNCKLPRLVDSV